MNRFICYFVCGHACVNLTTDVLFILHGFVMILTNRINMKKTSFENNSLASFFLFMQKFELYKVRAKVSISESD